MLDGDVDLILRAARAAWPCGFVETGDGSFKANVGAAFRKAWAVPSELFIYEDFAAYDSWTAHGLTDDNATKMVAVTFDADCISFVVNDKGGPTAATVAAIIDAIRENRWRWLALPEAA